MKNFKHVNAKSFEEVSALLQTDKNSQVIAGGTDLLGGLKREILSDSPETLINLKTIPNAAGIEEKDGVISIGAMTKLCDMERSEILLQDAKAVAEAAKSIATPIIRNQATFGGNLCQDVRCWFYRYPDSIGGRLDCARKGGAECYAIRGENRYHSIFGGMKVRSTPCSAECPAGTDIPAYMARIRANDWDGAAQIILQFNPMPMLTSRVCPHDCQMKCNQCKHGDSVNIHGVERSLGDYILEHKDRYYAAPSGETGKKTAVIGAGPGGLAAAYYLRKAGNAVTVYDSHEKPGGVLQYGIPHYRLPKHYVDDFAAALAGMGIEFRMNTEIGKDLSMENLKQNYDKIYLGTGAWRQPVLGLDGEELTEFGLNFLVDVNKYLTKAIGEEVLVCGGGNVAMDVALTAVRLGAKKVRLVCLEGAGEMPAQDEEVARAKEEGVEIFNGWGLKKILTDEQGRVSGLESMRCVSVRDENGRFAPKYDDADRRVFASDYIILATGQGVDISFLGEKFYEQLKTERGLISADQESYRTGDPDIYAGGDAVTGPNIAIRAIRAGRIAARNMNQSLGIAASSPQLRDGEIHFDREGVKEAQMHALPEAAPGERTLTKEDSDSFAPGEALAEAKRCMNCGCYSVNASDLSPVLVALDAVLVTNRRRIDAASFFTTKLKAYDMLDPDEVITSVEIPAPAGYVTGYEKFRLREAIDFAIASVAYAYQIEDGIVRDAKVVLGGVAPVPRKAEETEAFLIGKKLTEEVAEQAAELAVKDADPMEYNEYKIQEVKALVRRSLAAQI